MNANVAALRLAIDDWPAVIGLLWATALTHPHERETVGRLGSQLYAQYVQALGLDAEQLAGWLIGLPPELRQQVRDSTGRRAGQEQETDRG